MNHWREAKDCFVLAAIMFLLGMIDEKLTGRRDMLAALTILGGLSMSFGWMWIVAGES